MTNKTNPAKYTEEFKKTIVSLYQSGKTYAQSEQQWNRIKSGSASSLITEKM